MNTTHLPTDAAALRDPTSGVSLRRQRGGANLQVTPAAGPAFSVPLDEGAMQDLALQSMRYFATASDHPFEQMAAYLPPPPPRYATVAQAAPAMRG